MTSLMGSFDELSPGGIRSAAFLKFNAPPDCSMRNLGWSRVSERTWIGSLRSWL